MHDGLFKGNRVLFIIELLLLRVVMEGGWLER